jgi:hypothetical protein
MEAGMPWWFSRSPWQRMIAPLAHLFELGGATIWAPAILHFVIQATVKVVVIRATASEHRTPAGVSPILACASAAAACAT